MNDKSHDRRTAGPAIPQRRLWVAPRVERSPARDTRNAIDPFVEDGDFSFGS